MFLGTSVRLKIYWHVFPVKLGRQTLTPFINSDERNSISQSQSSSKLPNLPWLSCVEHLLFSTDIWYLEPIHVAGSQLRITSWSKVAKLNKNVQLYL